MTNRLTKLSAAPSSAGRPSPTEQRVTRALAVLAFLTSVAACSGSNLEPCPDPNFVDPVLTISELRNAQSNATLPSVTLTDLRVGNVRITNAFDLVQSGAPPRNAVAEGATIVCTLACGFGAAAGNYTFTLRRAGFVDTTVTVAASYATAERNATGCPTRLANGVSVALKMSPQEKN